MEDIEECNSFQERNAVLNFNALCIDFIPMETEDANLLLIH